MICTPQISNFYHQPSLRGLLKLNQLFLLFQWILWLCIRFFLGLCIFIRLLLSFIIIRFFLRTRFLVCLISHSYSFVIYGRGINMIVGVQTQEYWRCVLTF